MKRKLFYVAIFGGLIVSNAQAQTQVWQLDTTVTSTVPGAPSQFATVGEQVVVDYAINLSDPYVGGSFNHAIAGISIDGVSYPSSGYLTEFDSGFFALNGQYGPYFTSFNNFGATSTTSNIETALGEFSSAVVNDPGSTSLRIDINNLESIYTQPTSFGIAPAVPEPPTVIMALIGIALLFIARMRHGSRLLTLGRKSTQRA
jgi:hypothetical protein